MNGFIIKADPAVITATATEFENRLADMEGCRSAMQSKINELQNYFISDAGNEFISKYESVNSDILRCIENLRSEISALKNAANAFAAGSNNAEAVVDGLSSGSTFPNQG